MHDLFLELVLQLLEVRLGLTLWQGVYESMEEAGCGGVICRQFDCYGRAAQAEAENAALREELARLKNSSNRKSEVESQR